MIMPIWYLKLWHHMVGWLFKQELATMWNEEVLAISVPSWPSPGSDGGKEDLFEDR
jgi:hypothetical protein